MRSWGEVVDFVRGTRPRPPPGPKSPLVCALLVVASLAHLPLVYLLVHEGTAPALTLGVGLVAIGIGWSAGVALEGRRAGTTRAFAAVGVLEGALAFVPEVASSAGMTRWLCLLIAAVCAAALAVHGRVMAQPSS